MLFLGACLKALGQLHYRLWIVSLDDTYNISWRKYCPPLASFNNFTTATAEGSKYDISWKYVLLNTSIFMLWQITVKPYGDLCCKNYLEWDTVKRRDFQKHLGEWKNQLKG